MPHDTAPITACVFRSARPETLSGRLHEVCAILQRRLSSPHSETRLLAGLLYGVLQWDAVMAHELEAERTALLSGAYDDRLLIDQLRRARTTLTGMVAEKDRTIRELERELVAERDLIQQRASADVLRFPVGGR